jgi:hypothetical protein
MVWYGKFHDTSTGFVADIEDILSHPKPKENNTRGWQPPRVSEDTHTRKAKK